LKTAADGSDQIKLVPFGRRFFLADLSPLGYKDAVIEVRRTTVFMEWLKALRSGTDRAIIAKRLVRLANGNFGDVEPVGEGVSELRIHVGPGYRVYFMRRGATIVLLLCGGNKGSQTRDIARAKAMASEERT
jgi:putative addiction module killer protein